MQIYMKYEGIVGEGTGKYYGWIPLKAARLITPSSIGNVTYFTQPKAFSLTKLNDKVSPLLVQEVYSGKTQQEVTIEFVQAGDIFPYLIYKLGNANLTKVEIFGRGEGTNHTDTQSEDYVLEFDQISFIHDPQKTHETTHAKHSTAGRK